MELLSLLLGSLLCLLGHAAFDHYSILHSDIDTIDGNRRVPFPNLGVTFSSLGRLTLASNHYVATIHIPKMDIGFNKPSDFTNCTRYQNERGQLNYDMLCRLLGNVKRFHTKRHEEVRRELFDLQHDIRTLVPDSRDIHSRPRRFLGALTSLISLGMGAFRTYQQRVIKGQIRRIHSDLSHLRQNDDILKEALMNYHSTTIGKLNETATTVNNLGHVVSNLQSQYSRMENYEVKIAQTLASVSTYTQILEKVLGNMERIWSKRETQIRIRKRAVRRMLTGYLDIELIDTKLVDRMLTLTERAIRSTGLNLEIVHPFIPYYYKSKCVYVTRKNTDLHIHIFIPITSRNVVFDLYSVNSYHLPADHSYITNASTKLTNVAPYFGISTDKTQYIEVYDHQLQNCEEDSNFYTCSLEIPIKSDATNCAYSIYMKSENRILEHCQFDYYPLYEDSSTLMELTFGTYYIATPQQTWMLRCLENGTVVETQMQSCTLCTINLNCGCELITDQFTIPANLDSCHDPALTYIQLDFLINWPLLKSIEPLGYSDVNMENRIQQPYDLNLEQLTIIPINDVNTDVQSIKLHDLENGLEQGNVIDLRPNRKDIETNRFAVWTSVAMGILGFINLVVITAVIYRYIMGWKGKIISMGATMPSVITGFETENHTGCNTLPVWPLYVLSSVIIALLFIYLTIRLHKLCKSFPYTTKMKAQLNHIFLGQSTTSVNLEFITTTRYILVNLMSVPVTPERLKIVYDPNRLHCTIDTHLCFKVLNIELRPKPVISIDSEPTAMEMPTIFPISYSKARALSQLLKSTDCTMRITVTCGITQYERSVVTIVHPNPNNPDRIKIDSETLPKMPKRNGPLSGSSSSI